MRTPFLSRGVFLFLVFGTCGRPLAAQVALPSSGAPAQAVQPAPRSIAGRIRSPAPPAPAPIAPATVSRTPEGGVTVRAVRLREPLKIDGQLDEEVYAAVPAIADYIQMEPREGEPASEPTETWIFFDDRNVYVTARCWDSQPDRAVANEMRRDTAGIFQNDNFTVVFDTYYDRRNGMFFESNILGGLRDALITDETDQNTDWNGVRDARTSRFDRGWIVEMIIPFKTLRYRGGPQQVWGVNLRRIVRWKNEVSFLTPVPNSLGQQAMNHVSFAGTLVGLEVPASSRNLEVKPYGISGLRTDYKATPALENDANSDWGVDVKYGITKSLTLDLTYNTDFAQVEDDTQQVNLTRFNLFFPERREFFLEGRGIFAFGGAGTGAGGSSNTPVLFFSRRVGLNTVGSAALQVPIVAGGRLTGKVGRTSIGFLNIQSDDDEAARARATNFTVLRLKRDILRRSNVGLLYTRRDETAEGGAGVGETFGVDGLYSRSQFLNISGYFARTRAEGVGRDDTSHLARFDYNTDRYALLTERLVVDRNFAPQVGFLRRTDLQRSFGSARFSPRPARTHMRAVRRFVYQGSYEYISNNEGRRDWVETQGQFAIELQNSDRLSVTYFNDYEFVPRAFTIDAPSRTSVEAGGYSFQSGMVSYLLGTQHTASGTISYQHGSLYGGTKRTLTLSGGRIEVSSHFALEPTFSANWVDLPQGRFTSTVMTERTTLTFTPRMFVSALVQYNSSSRTLSTNARFRFEYSPGSELFVVYSDGRDTATIRDHLPELTNRAFIVKVNRLVRF